MITIPLSRGCLTIIDDEDAELAAKHKWYVSFSKSGKAYATAGIKKEGGKQGTVTLHSLILGGTSRKLMGDHINGNTLDNRRANLRLVTPSQNSQNQWKKETAYEREFKGITYKKSAKSWMPQICANRQFSNGGCWKTKECAALNYDLLSARLHGQYGKTNGMAAKRLEVLRAELAAQNSKRALENTIRRFKVYLEATEEEIALAQKEVAWNFNIKNSGLR